MVSNSDVMALRAKTGVGMMDCKRALTEADGDMDKAVELLRKRGMDAVAKKSSRIAAEGVAVSYIHSNGKIGVLAEINCESDFVAKSDDFQNFAHDICMHIAAANPTCVRIDEVDPEVVAKEREIAREQAINEGKPEAVVEKIVDGRIKKFYKETVLMEQEFVKDSSKTITQLVNEITLKLGEKITIRRFVRYEVGEGLTKRNENFAEEVMAQTKTDNK